jgi:hypothetical protein
MGRSGALLHSTAIHNNLKNGENQEQKRLNDDILVGLLTAKQPHQLFDR